MSSKAETIDYILTQMHDAGAVTARKMFGEYTLYCDSKVVALVCDDQLYVKPTQAGEKYLGNPELSPPYPGAKQYFLISEDTWEDSEWLSQLIKVTAHELPLPKPKKPKKP